MRHLKFIWHWHITTVAKELPALGAERRNQWTGPHHFLGLIGNIYVCNRIWNLVCRKKRVEDRKDSLAARTGHGK